MLVTSSKFFMKDFTDHDTGIDELYKGGPYPGKFRIIHVDQLMDTDAASDMRGEFIGKIALPYEHNRFLFLCIDITAANATIHEVDPIHPFIIGPSVDFLHGHMR